jgi:homoserine/homoserine lactone efflux protein
MSIESYLLYLAAVGVFFATPPDTSQLLIISNSIRYGLKRSKWTIAGDLSANCLQMTAAAFGLAAIIATSATAFMIVKWLGVFYLAWIGLKLFLSPDNSSHDIETSSDNKLRLYKQGFFTSLANPFAVAFFAALFPQFIDTSSAILPQLIILGSTYIIVDGVILYAWAMAGIQATKHLEMFQFSLINKVSGALMIAAAGFLAIKDIEPRNS